MAFSGIDREVFRRACARFATGVTVITTQDATGQPQGMTANSFTSVSLEPPLVLFSVDHAANMHECFQGATHFGVNVLRSDQQELSNRFAFKIGNRFEGLEWGAGVTGSPLLPGAIATLECEITRRLEAGDHTLVLGRVVSARNGSGEPLLFFDSAYRQLAPDPQPAPAEALSLDAATRAGDGRHQSCSEGA
jgi:flavin reductase (DIM6/NTAB) family NADH-FMN oxidoreductase RutF